MTLSDLGWPFYDSSAYKMMILFKLDGIRQASIDGYASDSCDLDVLT